jgi:diacylglycerol O-acyltransferase
MQTTQRLSALDAGFLALETDVAPLHVGALLVLDGPRPDLDQLRAELVGRTSRVRQCRQRVLRRAPGLRRPVWVEDADVQPGSQLHVSVLEAPGDREALRRRVVEIMSVRLDTAQPLWRLWVLDGLQDGSWAVLVTAHHTLVDGVSGSGLLSALLSCDPSASETASAPEAETGPARPPLHVSLRRLRQGVRTVAVADLPPSLLNGPLGPRRTWDWAAVELRDLRAVAKREGCSVNDVYLAAMSAALRSVLADLGAFQPATRVRVLVPVSLRRGADDVRGGNLDAAFFVDLPVHLHSVRAMLVDVAGQTARAKADGVPLATGALLHLGDVVPAPLLDQAARAYARRGQARVNLVASDVRGATDRLRLCDRAVREIVPCLPLALDVRVTSALMSYAGGAAISATVDSAAGCGAEDVVSAIVAALDDLVHERE